VIVTFNGQSQQLPAQATIASLLAQLELEPRRVAVEVNERLVPREEHARHALQDGDRLEVVTLAGGG
jgi:thiamine biosynthesis protein ThiS